jgi:2-methylcitrate dehydratase PrpD
MQCRRVDRRLFLGAGAATLIGAAGAARAQAQAPQAVGTGAAALKPTARVVDFVAGFDLKAVPALAIERARLAFIDTVGVMLAGSRSEPAAIVLELVRAEGAAPAASIVGQSLRSSPQLAALANGVASHALDFDFTYTQGQLLAPVIPALLPLAESAGATPAETLAAFIVGFEVCSRLSRANPNHNGGGAWHGTGTIGTIGAAAACARLIKLPAATIPDVLGIAVSMAAGVNANYGTMTKPLHAGQAARNAILAAQLGARSFTANPAAIEGRGGFASTFARGLEWQPQAFDDLGRQFDLAERGFRPKRYPCGGVIHTGIDAALKIREQLGAQVADITAIKAGISKYAANRASAVPDQHRGGEVQSAIRRRLFAGEGGADAVGLRRGGDPRRAGEGAGAHGVGLDRSGIRRRPRGLSDAAHGHAQGRAQHRGALRLCERHRAISDVAGADRGQVPRLREGGDRARARRKNPRHAARARRRAELRRFLAAGADVSSSRVPGEWSEAERDRDPARDSRSAL